MGTMTAEGGMQAVSHASSAAILILIGSRSQYQGRATLICGACGRGQFNKGQKVCVACHATLMIPLEPLCDEDAPSPKVVDTMEQCRRFCFRLRDLRIALGMPQSRMARAAGCVRTYITKYEHGRVIPTILSFQRLTAAIGITLAELVNERISVEQLATRSVIRSEEDALINSLVNCLPKIGKDSRALLLKTAANMRRSPLGPQPRG